MPLKIVRNDITKMKLDAIVSATDPAFSGSGGADGSIQRAAGHDSLLKCLGALRPGEAKLTRAGRLPCKYLIYTVGPVWQGRGPGRAGRPSPPATGLPGAGEKKGLQKPCLSPYRLRGLRLSQSLALKTAVGSISDFLMEKDMECTW